jgi:hypothetical protein
MTEAEWDDCTSPQKMLAFLGDKASPRKRRLCAAACCRRIWHFLPCERRREAVRCAERCADGLVSEQERGDAERQALDAFVPLGTAADALSCGTWNALDLLPDHERDRYEDAYQEAYRESLHACGDASEAWEASTAALAAYHALAGEEVGQFALCHAAKAVAHGCHGPRAELADPPDTLYARQHPWDSLPLGEAYVAPDPTEAARQCDLIADLFGNPFRPVRLAPAWVGPWVLSLARAAYDERQLPSGELDLARLSVLADALEEAGCSDGGLLSHLRSPGPHVRGCFAVDLCLGLS